MKRVLCAIAAAGLLAAACGGAAAPVVTSAPAAVKTTAAPTTAAPTPQTVYVFTADLKPENEIPPVVDAEATGSGTATVTLTTVKDPSGKVTGATAKFEIVLKGFPATTNITLSHVHKGDAKTVGTPLVDSGMKTTEPIALATGGTSITRDNLVVAADVASDIIANPGNYYFNVHSQVHPGGTVRSQLKAKS